MPIQIAGTGTGFKAWAILSSLVMAIVCLLAGACIMQTQTMLERYDSDITRGLKLAMQVGLPGVVLGWCGYMALLACASVAKRYGAALHIAMLIWVILTCLLSLGAIYGWMRMMFTGMRSVVM